MKTGRFKYIVLLYLVILIGLGGFIGVTDFMSRMGNSTYENLPEIFFFYVIPVVIAIAMLHILSAFLQPVTFKNSLLIGVFSGFIGPGILYFIIISSNSYEAEIAYFFMVIFYCAFLIIGFLAASTMSWLFKRRKEKKDNS